jgi:hypothetical protein
MGLEGSSDESRPIMRSIRVNMNTKTVGIEDVPEKYRGWAAGALPQS